MVSIRWRNLLFGGALALALLPFPARADTVSFGYEGQILQPTDDLLVEFYFTIGANSPNVFLATLSNGGGVFDAAAAPYGGQTVDPGGFETLLTLWTVDGSLLSTSATCGNAGSDACMGTDPDAYGSEPAGFTYVTLQPLAAGTYILALTEYGNYPYDSSLADGFDWDPSNYGLPSSGPGLLLGGNGNYAVEILNVNDAGVVPEPGGFWLFGGGMALIALGGFRRKRPGLPAGANPAPLIHG
jgi:hypothetical protein